jgi:hypothetical protein
MPWDAMAPAYSRLIEIHDPARVEARPPELQAFLETCDVPVWMQRRFDRYPTSEAYPLDEIARDVFGDWPDDLMFGSSIAYLLAAAIHERPDEIATFGVDLKDNHDHERPNIALLIGIGLGRGIRMTTQRSVLEMTRDRYPVRYGWPD